MRLPGIKHENYRRLFKLASSSVYRFADANDG
jgi:hypothetical protein